MVRLGHRSYSGARQTIERIEGGSRWVGAAELLIYLKAIRVTDKHEVAEFLYALGTPEVDVVIEGGRATARAVVSEDEFAALRARLGL